MQRLLGAQCGCWCHVLHKDPPPKRPPAPHPCHYSHQQHQAIALPACDIIFRAQPCVGA
jgi:hypothetical protein